MQPIPSLSNHFRDDIKGYHPSSSSLQVEEEGGTANNTSQGDGSGGHRGTILIVVVVVVLLNGSAGLADPLVNLGPVALDAFLGSLSVAVGGSGSAEGGKSFAVVSGERGVDVRPDTRRVVNDVLDVGLETLNGGQGVGDDIANVVTEVVNAVTDVADGVLNVIDEVVNLRSSL